jgi:hypothetical protein
LVNVHGLDFVTARGGLAGRPAAFWFLTPLNSWLSVDQYGRNRTTDVPAFGMQSLIFYKQVLCEIAGYPSHLRIFVNAAKRHNLRKLAIFLMAWHVQHNGRPQNEAWQTEGENMPSLDELRNRFSVKALRKESTIVESDESLIVDERSHLRPAQIIELKLGTALGRGTVLQIESSESLPTSRPTSGD